MWKNWISRTWRSAIEKNFALCCENTPTCGMAPWENFEIPNIEPIWFLANAPFRQSPTGLDRKRERRSKTKLIACYAMA